MEFNFTSKKLSKYSLITGLVLIFLTEPEFVSVHKGIFNDFESFLLEPIFIWSAFIFVSSIFLIFFSQEVFTNWYKKIFRWYLPLGLILTFLADTNVSYTFPNKVGFATLLGSILVVVTLIFALVQKFVYKR